VRVSKTRYLLMFEILTSVDPDKLPKGFCRLGGEVNLTQDARTLLQALQGRVACSREGEKANLSRCCSEVNAESYLTWSGLDEATLIGSQF
jgi:hypothetical protein